MDSSKTAEPTYVLPNVALIRRAEETLQSQVPATGLGLDAVQKHLMEDVAPALNASSRSSRYYGFVTGGATPAAIFADNMVTEFDQNVQVHLPNETIATNVEDAALRMVCDLVDLDPELSPLVLLPPTSSALLVLVNMLSAPPQSIITSFQGISNRQSHHMVFMLLWDMLGSTKSRS
jgi:hypothetical protein